jgi:hypothetical protein
MQNEGMEKSSQRLSRRGTSGTGTNFQSHGRNPFLNNTTTPPVADLSLYCISRALLGTTPSSTAWSSAAMLHENYTNNTLFRHPSLGLPAAQGGGWQARSSAAATGVYAPPTNNTQSGTPTSQMVLPLLLPTQIIRNLDQSRNVVSATLLSSLGQKGGPEKNPPQNSTSPAQSVDDDARETGSHKTAKKNEVKNYSTVPCRARGMPKDHNAKVSSGTHTLPFSFPSFCSSL